MNTMTYAYRRLRSEWLQKYGKIVYDSLFFVFGSFYILYSIFSYRFMQDRLRWNRCDKINIREFYVRKQPKFAEYPGMVYGFFFGSVKTSLSHFFLSKKYLPHLFARFFNIEKTFLPPPCLFSKNNGHLHSWKKLVNVCVIFFLVNSWQLSFFLKMIFRAQIGFWKNYNKIF